MKNDPIEIAISEVQQVVEQRSENMFQFTSSMIGHISTLVGLTNQMRDILERWKGLEDPSPGGDAQVPLSDLANAEAMLSGTLDRIHREMRECQAKLTKGVPNAKI